MKMRRVSDAVGVGRRNGRRDGGCEGEFVYTGTKREGREGRGCLKDLVMGEFVLYAFDQKPNKYHLVRTTTVI